MKKLLSLVIIIVIVVSAHISIYADEDKQITVIYFYSSTCNSCQNLNEFFNNLIHKNKKIKLLKYNISNLKSKSLLNEYNVLYKVSEKNEGVVPIVFVKNEYFIGENSIKENLNNKIMLNDGFKTPELENSQQIDFSKDINRFVNFKISGIIFAGLVNGINPCSLSLLLFFISLIISKRVHILGAGLSFIFGKFLTFLLLGTLFFNALSNINLLWVRPLTRILTIIIIIILIFTNLNDYYASKNENYNKIILQLPHVLKKLIHNTIRKVSSLSNSICFIFLAFMLGIIISFGEFLCTGQIYLATIITILQTDTKLNFIAFLYLFVYNLALVTPLLTLLFLTIKGREIFKVSEYVRKNLPKIKILNVLLYSIFIIILFL